MKLAENHIKGIYAFQITTAGQTHYMYSQSKEETYSWLEVIAPHHNAAKARANQLTQRTEPDGSIVLNIVVPAIQESKRLKFDSKAPIKDVRRMIMEKFKKSFERADISTGLIPDFL